MGNLSQLRPNVAKLNTIRVNTNPAVQRIAGRAGARIREQVLRRDGYLCQECARNGRVTIADEVDHIVPLHRGGSNELSNQEAICRECHRLKSEGEEIERRR